MKFRKSIAVCAACGKTFVKTRNEHRFCCVKCQRTTWKERQHEGIPSEMLCRFNDGVKCPPKGRTCEICNWNPQVAAEKLRRIRRELGCENRSD